MSLKSWVGWIWGAGALLAPMGCQGTVVDESGPQNPTSRIHEAVAPAAPATSIKVYAMNILAPCWASPSDYPSQCVGLLDTSRRRAALLNFIDDNKSTADALTFQETQTSENAWLSQRLTSGSEAFYYYSANHDDDYWARWITQDPPFQSNGVAIAVSKAKYDSCTFVDYPLGTGNHAAIATCRNKSLDTFVRMASVHLDSDRGGRRKKESAALRSWFTDSSGAYIDIIAGDFNASTSAGVVHIELTSGAHFVDVLAATGHPEQTHPYSTGYNGNTMYGPIDHVLARGAGVTPSEGTIYDSNLWTQYPNLNGANDDPNEALRICANLQAIGSDHYYISGTITR